MKIALPACRRPRRRAFTLLELLGVMAIIVVLLGLVGPAIIGPNAARQLTNSTYQITGVIDRARADAMARNTYRYVAVETTVIDGRSSIRLTTLGYRPRGRFPDDTAALQLLSPAVVLSNVQIADSSNDPLTRPPADQIFAKLQPSYRHTVSPLFTNAFLLELASNGQAQLIGPQAGDPAAPGKITYERLLCHWMEIELQATHGTAVSGQTNPPDRAIVQIAGLTGQSQVYTP